MTPSVEAILFDKDGTLFDFAATWNVWARNVIRELANGDDILVEALADAVRFDLADERFLPESRVIAGTNRVAAEALASVLPGQDVEEMELFLSRKAAAAPLAEAVPLAPFLDGLREQGLTLGVMTNDAEAVAHTHLQAAGVADRFAFVAGFDSGYGAKPEPEPLLAFCRTIGVPAAQTLMVGDSGHDLVAGRAAGMRTVGVLTGVAGEAELARFADVVLPDIGHIPEWLAR